MGGSTSEGLAELVDAIGRGNCPLGTALTVEHVLSHGKAGAVSGRITCDDRVRAFCDALEFNNARVPTCGLTSPSGPVMSRVRVERLVDSGRIGAGRSFTDPRA